MNSKIKLMLVALFATIAPPGIASAQDECSVFNQIIDSGLDRQNPFAAVAGVTLPNADECRLNYGDHDDEWNDFECSWNEENEKILEKMEEDESELFDTYIDHDGGHDAFMESLDAWKEAEALINKYNNTIEYAQRHGVRLNPYEMDKLKRQARNWEQKAQAYEQEAKTLDREHDEAEAKYEAKEAEREKFEEEFERLSDKQVDDLYTGLYACFSSGAIRNAEAYMVDPQDKSWTQDGGCEINIDSGPTLWISCPNPNYQSQ